MSSLNGNHIPVPSYLADAEETDGWLPARRDASKPRKDRFVGLFYFLWAGQHGTEGPYDIRRILAKDLRGVSDPNHPLWGPPHSFHHWGEPLYGYYRMEDAWVLRKHAQLLTNAGIDFLVFDTTNTSTYPNVYDILLSILSELKGQGWNTPHVAFYTNTKSGETIERIYRELYQPGRYAELWFRWKGKPLIIGDPTECPEEIRDFFTFRLNQWPNEEQKINGFPWIEFVRPQRVFFNDEGDKEIINVSVAQHPSVVLSDTPFYGYGGNWGRGYHNGVNDQSAHAVGRGMNIAEQWDFAIAEDPQIIFVTGWNEWIAMRFPGPDERPVRFIDQATMEFSRDIEPMKGGFGDAYYRQMVAYIRKFKGIGAPPSAGDKKTIRIDGDFNQWRDVHAEYRDFVGDTVVRRHPGYGGILYEDRTGRNDFDRMKVARDDQFLYFYVKTVDPITPYTDPYWMMLLLRVEGTSRKEWEGYHYQINRLVVDDKTTTLERCLGGWNWESAGTIRYRTAGNELHLAVPRSLVGLTLQEGPLRFQFKWVDNLQQVGEAMDFYVSGDCAPDGRLNYLYSESTEAGK